MFWKKRKSKAGGGLGSEFEALLQFAADVSSWEALQTDQLKAAAFFRFIQIGKPNPIGQMAMLDPHEAYRVLRQRLTRDDRLDLVNRIIAHAEEDGASFMALAPALTHETDAGVGSTAAVAMAMLHPRKNGDPLTGPKFLLETADQPFVSETARVGILSGLALLGDERVKPLLLGVWRKLKSTESRRILAAASNSMVTTLQIDFLIDWLEHAEEDADIGSVAGAMCRMPSVAMHGRVFEVTRCFPASECDDGDPVDVVNHWSFPEYAEVIRPRLEPIIAAESHPRYIPKVLEYWSAAE